ncbi:hypothetical protein GCM10017691_00460 [Pseudonocardia petroleophila]|uniref:Alpha/beta hydrolase n=1 Tax=Pseudonocardia petroleophila TaxID=37331 RepID=A0A7G7MLI6_9PSEU|nr:alpha/beta hydrolase [Pseudonocardia petroleophila]QNG53647.1 alpha/beta hydrolase [Pseudonocardia petroleophila]
MLVRLLLALACVGVPAWVLATRWSTVLNDHPAYLVLLVALVVVGATLGLRARRPRPSGRWRTTGRVAAAVLLVAVLGAVGWLRPFAATSGDPLAVGTPTTWELRPSGPVSDVGVVFYPGARVDPRAYLALLRPLADDGHPVVVVKPPLDIALLVGAPPFDDHPEVSRWVVGGHSLGGTAAAMVDDPRVAGLLLWASYPADDQSSRDLPTLSVSGDRDGLATPADIADTAPRLPAGARLVTVPGGVHAFFGDYGEQPGDGVPATDRATAQRQIVEASRAFVDELG